MYYNLDAFGKKVVEIRKSHNLTRNQLHKLSFVSTETIRKIETGKYLPSHRILDDLSNILKVDLNQIILEFRLDNFSVFDDIKNRMELKFDNDEFYTLEKEYDDFKDLLLITKNKYFRQLINQLILLIEAVILYKKEEKHEKAIQNLIKSMQISTPEFTLSDYKSFTYNSTEIRILMNIALILRKLEPKEKPLEIMEFCMGEIDKNDKLYPKLCYNLSGIYLLMQKYNESLECSILGIEYCLEKRKLNGLNLLYYIKGIAEYNLHYIEYIKSLNKSLTFCEILGQDNLKKVIINNCKEFYNIELDIIKSN